jgi:uncharacterized phage protein gp47/JayE
MYFAPYIGPAGLSAPSYSDIRDRLVEEFKSIYGQDLYLGNDSQDYQLLSIFALFIHDTHQLLAAVYNNRGPQTAVGSGLDGVVKLNGVARKKPSYSTVGLTLTGLAGTRIENGAAQDAAGERWLLPAEVVIGEGGSVEVNAVAETIGAIAALPGAITGIATPTYGWLAVNNVFAAIAGQPVEKDSQLRARQTISTMLNARALLDGVRGAVANVEGITRLRIYENDSEQTDVNTLPPHSVAVVAEGGLDRAVAQAIALRKTPGCYTYGDTEQDVVDEAGLPARIRFFRPAYKTVNVTVTVRPLDGFTTARLQTIQANVEKYLNSLDIGEDVLISSLWGAALLAVSSLEKPMYAIAGVACAFTGGEPAGDDLPIAFNEAAEAGTIAIEVP